jgi:protein involved in polysaccharide export with SLBB domain
MATETQAAQAYTAQCNVRNPASLLLRSADSCVRTPSAAFLATTAVEQLLPLAAAAALAPDDQVLIQTPAQPESHECTVHRALRKHNAGLHTKAS